MKIGEAIQTGATLASHNKLSLVNLVAIALFAALAPCLYFQVGLLAHLPHTTKLAFLSGGLSLVLLATLVVKLNAHGLKKPPPKEERVEKEETQPPSEQTKPIHNPYPLLIQDLEDLFNEQEKIIQQQGGQVPSRPTGNYDQEHWNACLNHVNTLAERIKK